MPPKDYAERLLLASRVTAPAIRQAIQGLSIPFGSAGLDAGCGAGQHALWLAESVGPEGKVTGLDIFTDNLSVARELADRSPFGNRVHFAQVDLLHLPFEDNSFDWAWCADVIWPRMVCDDPVSCIRGLARVVKPGGIVAILYWSSQCLLPGHPALEARLNAAFAATTPYLSDVAPNLHFLRALSWLEVAGLQQVTAHTYVADLQAPATPKLREAIAYCLSMLWGNLEPHVSEDDWDAYQRICNPESAEFILNRPDYYGFLTYTLFSGRVA